MPPRKVTRHVPNGVAFILVDQAGVKAIEKIAERVEKLGAPIGVDCRSQFESGVDGLPFRGRTKGALGSRQLLVVDTDDRPSHLRRVCVTPLRSCISSRRAVRARRGCDAIMITVLVDLCSLSEHKVTKAVIMTSSALLGGRPGRADRRQTWCSIGVPVLNKSPGISRRYQGIKAH
jgi:hypothetical protein